MSNTRPDYSDVSSHNEGTVVENVGKRIRRKRRELATTAWAQRDRQGAIARVRDELHKDNLHLRQFLQNQVTNANTKTLVDE